VLAYGVHYVAEQDATSPPRLLSDMPDDFALHPESSLLVKLTRFRSAALYLDHLASLERRVMQPLSAALTMAPAYGLWKEAVVGLARVMRWLFKVCTDVDLGTDRTLTRDDAEALRFNVPDQATCGKADALLTSAPVLVPTVGLRVSVSLSDRAVLWSAPGEPVTVPGLEAEFLALLDEFVPWQRLHWLGMRFPFLTSVRRMPALNSVFIDLVLGGDEWRTIRQTELTVRTMNRQLRGCLAQRSLDKLVVLGPRATLRPTYPLPLSLLSRTCDVYVSDFNLSTAKREGASDQLYRVRVVASPLPSASSMLYTYAAVDLSGVAGVSRLYVGSNVTVYGWPHHWLLHLCTYDYKTLLAVAYMSEWCQAHPTATFDDFCNETRQVEFGRIARASHDPPALAGQELDTPHRRVHELMLAADPQLYAEPTEVLVMVSKNPSVNTPETNKLMSEEYASVIGKFGTVVLRAPARPPLLMGTYANLDMAMFYGHMYKHCFGYRWAPAMYMLARRPHAAEGPSEGAAQAEPSDGPKAARLFVPNPKLPPARGPDRLLLDTLTVNESDELLTEVASIMLHFIVSASPREGPSDE